MIYFYKIEDNNLQRGSGITAPKGFTEYDIDNLPSEVVTGIAKIESEAAAIAYQGSRRSEYPAIGDQLDALFHAGVFPAEMAAEIQAVKDKYPK